MTSSRRLLLLLTLLALGAHAQQDAALQKVQSRYTAEQIDDLRQHGHHKYQGLLLFYGSSFLVQEGLEFREATEEEILMVDLHVHDNARLESEDAIVEDAATGKRLLLFSRDRFETMVLASLSVADRHAYLTCKAAALAPSALKSGTP